MRVKNEDEDIEMVVYYDTDYPSAWIANKSERIALFLQNKAIKIKTAEELKEFMSDSIEKENGYKKLVVFSQDVIPDTIAENYTSTTTLREFLDQGGSVLWMGDIPLFNIGKKGEKKLNDDAWKNGAPVTMLGVVPIFAPTVKRGVNITYEGKRLGLKHKWSGIRPILPDTKIKSLAEAEVIYSVPYLSGILSKGTVDRLKKPTKRKGIEIEAGIPPLKMSYKTEVNKTPEMEVNRRFLHEVFPNAWLKNYNDNYPFSGFYRIWDFSPINFPDWMLEELYTVIKSIGHRFKRVIK